MKTPCTSALCGLLLIGQVPGKTIPNHAVADLVLGQTNFTSGSFVSPVNSFSSDTPYGVAVDPVTRKVFVAELDGDRILRYANASALANGAGAEAVFGQANFADSVASTDAQGVSDPNGLFFDRKGRLWVADTGNSRVIAYEAASFRETNATADRVFGQIDFITATPTTTATGMNSPRGVFVDSDDRLWVADSGNNRVLRFDAISTKSNGVAANGVLGQALFTTATAGTGAAAFSIPTSVAVSSTGALFVASRSNNRVVRFNNAASLVNGANATAVFGQLDFTTTTAGLSATQMSDPQGVWITPEDSLWVCDSNNNRIIRFDQASTSLSGVAAKGVVGQPGFNTSTAAITSQGFSVPGNHPFVDATGSLWVPDRNSQRVLRFPPDVTKPLLAVTGTVPKTTPKKKLLIKGTASDAFGIAKVQFRVGNGPLKTATGTINWQFKAPLKIGKNTVTIFATDSVGNTSIVKTLKIKRTENPSADLAVASGD